MQDEISHTDAYVSEHAESIRNRLVSAVGTDRGAKARIEREAGFSRGYLTRLLSGQQPFSIRHLVLLGGVMGVSVDWLITGDGHPADVDEKATPMVSTGHGDTGALSPDQVGKLLAAVE